MSNLNYKDVWVLYRPVVEACKDIAVYYKDKDSVPFAVKDMLEQLSIAMVMQEREDWDCHMLVDLYYPVIESALDVYNFYCPKICTEVEADMIERLCEARSKFSFKRS